MRRLMTRITRQVFIWMGAYKLFQFYRIEDGDQSCRPCEVKPQQEFHHERNDRNYCTSIGR